MKTIQSKLHRIGTYDVCKISLSFFDDRKNILSDDINSLACFRKKKKSVKQDKSNEINEIKQSQ